MEFLQQGETLLLETAVIENGILTDLTPAADIRVALVTRAPGATQEIVVYTYSFDTNVPVSYGKVLKKAGMGNTNIFQVVIERSQSAQFPTGTYSLAVALRFPNVNFDGGFETRELYFPNVLNVQPGRLRQEPFQS